MSKARQGKNSRSAQTHEEEPAVSPPSRRVTVLLFLVLLFAYAYFCPGGGWNQNARFDQVRAIVEGGTFAINDFLVYAKAESGGEESKPRLVRRPLPAGTPVEKIWVIGNTGDVTRHEEHVYPGKPPGTVLLAVPAYWVIHQIEKRLGVDPDDWWPLTVNAYLTRVFSVGLISAIGAIVFLRLSRRLFPAVGARGHVLGTLTLCLGTMLWPFSTLFFDHNIVAVLLLAAFALLVQVRDERRPDEEEDDAGPSNRPVDKAATSDARRGPMPPGGRLRLFAAGILLGLATVCNYLAVIPVIIFSVYALATVRPLRRVVWLWEGGLLLALFLAWYHAVCFGSMIATANTDEPGMFQDSKLFLGMFGKPDLPVLWGLLFSPYRGLFFFSPVLLIALFVLGVALMLRQRRAEMLACVAIFVAYVAANVCFQGWSKAWSGGWSYGPRYLIPGVALLALPLCAAFDRLPRLTLALAGYSFLLMLLGTAVDPQPPVDIRRPIGKYQGPLALGETVKNGANEISGSVSANPIGVYEAFYYRAFQPGSLETRWNSFNLGEFLWPGRRLSVLPLLAVLGGGFWLLWRWTKVVHRGTETQRNR